jgi:hypothetical protein
MRNYKNNPKENSLNQNKNIENSSLKKKLSQSKRVTDDFFKTFIQTCVLAQWRYQIIARKYQKRNNRKPTKKDTFQLHTKKLFNTTANIFADHLVNYLYDLCDIMQQMPEKPGIKHDKNFGTIKIVNNRTLDIKSMKRIKFLSKLYFIIRINSNLEEILIESINKMKENRKKK